MPSVPYATLTIPHGPERTGHAGGGVREAIARAAQATGVEFDYLLTKAKLESSLNPDARAPTSSAAGLYQFIGSTWLETLDRHGAAHGLGWAGQAIGMARGRAHVADPQDRAAILGLRHDLDLSALMAAELARDNAAGLAPVLGRAPDGPELYLAHFLGLEGATRFLTAFAADPAQSAVRLFPRPAAANRAIFHHGNGAARSVGEVMGVIRAKYERAQLDESTGGPARPATAGMAAAAYVPAPFARPGLPNPASMGSAAPARPSMAEVLRTTFLGDAGAGAPSQTRDQVRVAYERLRSFGL